jgi:hypothetical protein
VGKVQGRRRRIKRGLSLSAARLNALPRPEPLQLRKPAAATPQLPTTTTQTEHQLDSPVSLLWNENEDAYMNWPTLDIDSTNGQQQQQLDFDAHTSAFFAEDAAKGTPYNFSPGMPATCLATPDADIDKTFASLPPFHDTPNPDMDALMSPSLTWPAKPSPSPTHPPSLPLSLPRTYPQPHPHPYPSPYPYHHLPPSPSPDLDREKIYLATSLRAIDHLERNVLAHLSALDEILSLNRRTLADIDAFSAQPAPHSTSCLVVSAVLLHLVVGLFESGCAVFEPESCGEGGGGGQGAEGGRRGFTLPRLEMGGFTLDAEEQRVWGRRVVAKELRRCGGVVQRLGEVMEGDGKGGVYDACFGDLEPRLKALISLVEE